MSISEGECIADVVTGSAEWVVVQADNLFAMGGIPDGAVDHVITDPPYSEQVHKSVRSAKRNEAPDVEDFRCRTRRVVDLGFEHITADQIEAITDQIERLCKRWALVFSDVESCHMWRGAFVEFDYVRTAAWHRLGGAPQFTGDRPASGFECITIAHPKGRKRWNGGGKAGIYMHPIVANRLGQRGTRCHPAQKPEPLMLDLVRDFTDAGDLVLDPYCGSGSTGVACLRLGRRFVGIERMTEHVETARDRLRAESVGSDLAAYRSGQPSLFEAI